MFENLKCREMSNTKYIFFFLVFFEYLAGKILYL